jgi:transposase
MSQYQLIPYNRVEDYFVHEVGLNVSVGSIFNFNNEAYQLLETFENICKEKLINSEVINVDETGVNINGKRLWLHVACNEKWTYFYPHKKRGSDAMKEMNILPMYQGIVCHDHWKPYYTFKHYLNALCNAHHLRELEWSSTQDNQKWASMMASFLCKLKEKVEQSKNNQLSKSQIKYYRKKYDDILDTGDKECPPPTRDNNKPKRGRIKKTKSRNLLERFRDYKDDVLRFMVHSEVPFTNNRGENDIRMTKIQQKISGCFRSMDGAYIYCRIRAYLITCNKHGIEPSEALEILFKGELPYFASQFGE